MLVQLRLNVPADLVAPVLELLDDPRVAHLSHQPGGSLRPAGDLIEADVAREAADDLLDELTDLGLDRTGGMTVSTIDAVVSRRALRAARAAIGASDDGVIWPVVADQAEGQSRASYAYYVFLALGCALAAIAVITDSPVLVIGAMVVSPDFAPVSAFAVGAVLRRPSLMARAARLLVASFVVAIAAVTVLALIGRLTGVITLADLTEPRPLTGFIWHPDLWSLVVALLAGIAGILSMATGKSQTLVGVFISVTTVPAAGNLALALAFLDGAEIVGSITQLGLNIGGMTVAGILTLLALRLIWDHVLPRRRARAGRVVAARR